MKYARVCSHDLWVPDNVADWDAVAGDSPWEKERLQAIIDHMGFLGPGHLLWDIGAEHGWMTAIIGKATGCRFVLVEPTPEFWPNIKGCFQFNGLGSPVACVSAFCGEASEPSDGHWASVYTGGWPPDAIGPEAPARSYAHINHPRGEWNPPTVSIDWLRRVVGHAPDGLTIDVEGAELSVLKGGSETLRVDRPMVWVSIHPDLMERDFGTLPTELFTFMGRLGYTARHLRTDHEEHWEFRPA